MKKYRVEFADSSKADIALSYEWGQKEWGVTAAKNWYKLLKKTVRQALCILPLGFPLAPENLVYAAEIRQITIGRYRVLFSVENRTVRVLHVRGPFADPDAANFEDIDE